MEERRDFKGVWIPKEIWLCRGLSAIDKVVLAEIASLDSEPLHCVAGNEYFADFCGTSTRTISRTITKLSNMSYINTKNVYGKCGSYREISLAEGIDNLSRGSRQNVQGVESFCPPINITNNTINKKESNTSKEVLPKKDKFSPPSIDDVKAYCDEKGYAWDPESFFDFYESKGWFVGKNKMKDWKAACRNWNRSEHRNEPKKEDSIYDYIMTLGDKEDEE